MNFFEEAAERLKHALGKTQDKEISEALGLTPQAWNNRKKRDQFPSKEVFALAAKRPELGLDPDWIVTGTSLKTEVAGKEEISLIQCYRMMNSQNQYQLRQMALLWSGVMVLTSAKPEAKEEP